MSLWDSYGLADYELRSGSFSQDHRGRWHLNIVVKAQAKPTVATATASVGIDLGLKDCATASNEKKEHGRWYRQHELELAKAQRAHKKHRVKAIHAKIANQRKDALHKFSTTMVRENAAIFVGDVASAKLVKTKMAKSTLDAGWATLKKMLEYKSHQAGIVFMEVNEAYSTQTCSCCGSIPASSPKGRAGLRIREWKCSDCGAEHDRDVNAARNILAAGHRRLAVGISRVYPGEDVNAHSGSEACLLLLEDVTLRWKCLENSVFLPQLPVIRRNTPCASTNSPPSFRKLWPTPNRWPWAMTMLISNPPTYW
ncbi:MULTISPECIES: RNA-guided endonuclease InsQ/TnpB family protein [Giesbergeria]|uniref:RNA-guided endonuclease InsQ/TnpB family protein n=1 Tax=Giesbergeria sinuosa TaxID=80883 RepID=A0ABV9QFK9_9BURK